MNMSILPEIEEIPDLPHDSAIPATKITSYGLVYKEGEVFYLILFDPLGQIVNAVELQSTDAMNEINFAPNTIAFCAVVVYDVFTDHTILGTLELDGPVDDVLTREIKKDKHFIQTLYREMINTFVTPKEVLI